MSRYIDISPELLLEMCQQGARLTIGERSAVCIKGVSAEAKVDGVEVIQNYHGQIVRVRFVDPAQPDGDEPALWKLETRVEP